MVRRSAPFWRSLSASRSRPRSLASRIQVYNPLKRRRAHWHALAKPELLLLLRGLLDWEARSGGPVRARIRRKRTDLESLISMKFGAALTARIRASERLLRSPKGVVSHCPCRENLSGPLWHEG